MTPQVADKMAATETKMVPCQKTFFDLDSFSEVTLKKEFSFSPVGTVQEAAARLGNDASRLIKIINDGLISEQRRHEYTVPTGWKVLSEDGELSADEFTGTPANQD